MVQRCFQRLHDRFHNNSVKSWAHDLSKWNIRSGTVKREFICYEVQSKWQKDRTTSQTTHLATPSTTPCPTCQSLWVSSTTSEPKVQEWKPCHPQQLVTAESESLMQCWISCRWTLVVLFIDLNCASRFIDGLDAPILYSYGHFFPFPPPLASNFCGSSNFRLL